MAETKKPANGKGYQGTAIFAFLKRPSISSTFTVKY